MTVNPLPVIYFLIAETVLKIGTTTALPSRISALKTACPETISGVRVMRGGPKDEKVLHQRFEPYRSTREWFRICDPIQSFYASFCKVWSKPWHPDEDELPDPYEIGPTYRPAGVPVWADRYDTEAFIGEDLATAVNPAVVRLRAQDEIEAIAANPTKAEDLLPRRRRRLP